MAELSSFPHVALRCENVPVVGMVYRHYKGNCYRVIALSRHSETHEMHVVYQALYDSPQFGDHAVWVRPLSLFTDIVVVNGIEMSRFCPAD